MRVSQCVTSTHRHYLFTVHNVCIWLCEYICALYVLSFSFCNIFDTVVNISTAHIHSHHCKGCSPSGNPFLQKHNLHLISGLWLFSPIQTQNITNVYLQHFLLIQSRNQIRLTEQINLKCLVYMMSPFELTETENIPSLLYECKNCIEGILILLELKLFYKTENST